VRRVLIIHKSFDCDRSLIANDAPDKRLQKVNALRGGWLATIAGCPRHGAGNLCERRELIAPLPKRQARGFSDGRDKTDC
jgi:hypothetical protein